MEYFGVLGKESQYFYDKVRFISLMTKVEQYDRLKAMQNVPQYERFSSLRDDENFSPKVTVVISVYNVEVFAQFSVTFFRVKNAFQPHSMC